MEKGRHTDRICLRCTCRAEEGQDYCLHCLDSLEKKAGESDPDISLREAVDSMAERISHG